MNFREAVPAPADAIALQKRLAGRVELRDRLPDPVQRIAGVDVAFPDRGRITRAAVVVMSWPGLEVLETRIHEQPTAFPYIPGLLSFRELPAILPALETLDRPPDLVLCDGQGIAHPRRFGIACHLGVETGLATIGVGKSRLTGDHTAPGNTRGARADLMAGEERLGVVLRSRTGVRPLYVSPGHRVSPATAAGWVERCLGKYRLPEPVRAADRLAGDYRR